MLCARLPVGLQEHQAMGLLLALLHDGAAGPLLIERRYTLTEQVRQLIMLSPAKLWTAQEIARRLAMGTSTLRRRLQRESQSYRQIVEEVRMSCALSQLQSTTLPIGEIALRCGYLSGSRFTARFRQHYGCPPSQVRCGVLYEPPPLIMKGEPSCRTSALSPGFMVAFRSRVSPYHAA